MNIESENMLELIDDIYLNNERGIQGDQSFSVNNTSSLVSAIPASSTPLLDHSYAVINPNAQELIKENNATDVYEEKKRRRIIQ